MSGKTPRGHRRSLKKPGTCPGWRPPEELPECTTSRVSGILLASEAWSSGVDDAESWQQAPTLFGRLEQNRKETNK